MEALITEIVKLVDSTADQVRGIATASEEQSASSGEINQAIVKVNVIAGDTAQAMVEAAQAASELSRQAHALNQFIHEMKNS